MVIKDNSTDLPIVAFYIDDNKQVRSGALVAINEPDEEAAAAGAETLYDFGHGYSTKIIYQTKEEAEQSLQGGM